MNKFTKILTFITALCVLVTVGVVFYTVGVVKTRESNNQFEDYQATVQEEEVAVEEPVIETEAPDPEPIVVAAEPETESIEDQGIKYTEGSYKIYDYNNTLDKDTYADILDACNDYMKRHNIKKSGYYLWNSDQQYSQVNATNVMDSAEVVFFIDLFTMRTASTQEQLVAGNEASKDYYYNRFNYETATDDMWWVHLDDTCMLNVLGGQCIKDLFNAYERFYEDTQYYKYSEAKHIYLSYAGDGNYYYHTDIEPANGTIVFDSGGFSMSAPGGPKYMNWTDSDSYIEVWN